jgi:hypothetical protein
MRGDAPSIQIGLAANDGMPASTEDRPGLTPNRPLPKLLPAPPPRTLAALPRESKAAHRATKVRAVITDAPVNYGGMNGWPMLKESEGDRRIGWDRGRAGQARRLRSVRFGSIRSCSARRPWGWARLGAAGPGWPRLEGEEKQGQVGS